MKKLLAIIAILLIFPSTAFAAIAWDAAGSSNGGASWTQNTSSYNFSFTVGSLTNGIMVCGVTIYSSAVRTVSGITYTGGSMTKINAIAATLEGFNQSTELWYGLAPSSGSNTVTITLSGTAEYTTTNCSTYSGVSQSSPIDSNNTGQNTSNASSFTLTDTVVGSNTWLVGYAWNRDTSISAGSGTTLRVTNTGSISTLSDSAAVVGTGSQTQNYNVTGSAATWPGGNIIALTPAGAVTTNFPTIQDIISFME